MNPSLIEMLQRNTDEMLRAANDIPEVVLHNRVTGGWTGIQILEHLILTDRLIGDLIFQSPAGIADGEFLIGDAGLKKSLLDDPTPMQPPDMVIPTGTVSTRLQFIDGYSSVRGAIIRQLLLPCGLARNRYYPNPFFGQMTLGDWLLFMIYHTQRHVRQLHGLEKGQMRAKSD